MIWGSFSQSPAAILDHASEDLNENLAVVSLYPNDGITDLKYFACCRRKLYVVIYSY